MQSHRPVYVMTAVLKHDLVARCILGPQSGRQLALTADRSTPGYFNHCSISSALGRRAVADEYEKGTDTWGRVPARLLFSGRMM